MRYLKQFRSAGVLLGLGLLPTAQAVGLSPQGVFAGDELGVSYPKPPNKLDTDPTTSSVLLIDIDFKSAAFGRADGVALVTRDNGHRLIRSAPMKGDLVMFHTLEPGTYSLRFIRVPFYRGGETQPSEILVVEPPPEISVTVAAGTMSYLGTVAVSRKARFGGFKPPEVQLTYDQRREIEAWSAFKKKYPDGPWAALADGRIQALKSGQAPAAAAVAAPGREAEDPLARLAGEWRLTPLVIGAGQFGGGPKCGTSDRPGPPPVTLAPPSDGAVSFAAACDDRSEYSFRLRHDPAGQAYVLTVKSGPGISIQDFPVEYFEGKGWRGERTQLVDGETQSVTATVEPIEGRNWYGWMIAVLLTAAVNAPELADIKKPYFRADLTRRK